MEEFIRSIFYVERLSPSQRIKSLKTAKLQRQSDEAENLVKKQEGKIAVNVYGRIGNLWDSGKGEAFVHEVAILYALESLPQETEEALLLEARKILREKIQEEQWTNDQIYQLGIEILVEARREFPHCHGHHLMEWYINLDTSGRNQSARKKR
uniref:Uncharacterized protein n=1 Tax=Ditylenchus dipsaci TaxID=166011 RepID=A0A915DBL8_9BILA